MPIPDQSTREKFLSEDLYDALRWLFEGAIAWEAARGRPKCAGRHQIVLGMYASLVQARALYEFFYGHAQGDDARVRHFTTSCKTTWKLTETNLYKNYMKKGKPANKRVFHLVYNRARHARGPGYDAPDHLKNQVLEFAEDLRRLTEEFASRADPAFCDCVRKALTQALEEADCAARYYGIANPLRPAAGTDAARLRTERM